MRNSVYSVLAMIKLTPKIYSLHWLCLRMIYSILMTFGIAKTRYFFRGNLLQYAFWIVRTRNWTGFVQEFQAIYSKHLALFFLA